MKKAPEQYKKELTILQEYSIGLRKFREDITNISYYYNKDKNGMAIPNKKFDLLGAYDQAQVETKLYYDSLSYKLAQRKDEITFWDEIYVLLLAEVYLCFYGNNEKFCKQLWDRFEKMQEVKIEEPLLDDISRKLSESKISNSPWSKQIVKAIEELKNRENRNWMLKTTYQYAEEKEDGFIEWFFKQLTENNSFFARNVYLIPQAGSSGEEGFVNLFAYIDDVVAKINAEGKKQKKKIDVLLLIDEIDCYFHPAWQQRAMKYILDWLQELYKHCRFQIVVSSHSPIILSDFTREQIIKLKKENGKCVIQQDKEETFGANIAHLYYDAFFMEKGQIGEFAKERITEAITYVQNTEERQNADLPKVKYTIAHIGDKFMKRKLVMELMMKDEKMRSIINNYLSSQQEIEREVSEESEPEL